MITPVNSTHPQPRPYSEEERKVLLAEIRQLKSENATLRGRVALLEGGQHTSAVQRIEGIYIT